MQSLSPSCARGVVLVLQPHRRWKGALIPTVGRHVYVSRQLDLVLGRWYLRHVPLTAHIMRSFWRGVVPLPLRSKGSQR